MSWFSKVVKPKERYTPVVEPDNEFIIIQKTVGTSVTRLIEGDYRGYEVILLANVDNSGAVTIGGEKKSTVTFPLLKTQYLYVRCDLDKIFAVGTDAGDKVDIILQKERVLK